MDNIRNILQITHFSKTIQSVKLKSYIYVVMSSICMKSETNWKSYEYNLLVDAAMENLRLCRILIKNCFADTPLAGMSLNFEHICQ